MKGIIHMDKLVKALDRSSGVRITDSETELITVQKDLRISHCMLVSSAKVRLTT
jgi:hypothetical protein